MRNHEQQIPAPVARWMDDDGAGFRRSSVRTRRPTLSEGYYRPVDPSEKPDASTSREPNLKRAVFRVVAGTCYGFENEVDAARWSLRMIIVRLDIRCPKSCVR